MQANTVKLSTDRNLAKAIEDAVSFTLAISAAGRFYFYTPSENQESVPVGVADKIRSFFVNGDAIGLLRLGLTNFGVPLPPSIFFWQQFAQIFIAEVCKQSGFDTAINNLALPYDEFHQWMNEAPFIRGIEYLNQEVVNKLWQALIKALAEELTAFDGSIEAYFTAYHAAWNTVGRVCFHLAENKANSQHPFAFLATYTTRLSADARPQHLPLGRALEDYAGNNKKSQLLALLLPVQKAAERSVFLRNIVDSGAIFQPQAWSAKEAHEFLKDCELFEAAGVMVRVPNWWNPKKPPHPNINITIGKQNSSTVGLDALLDFDMHFALPSGEQLTAQEFNQLLSSQEQLIQIKGQWVQVDSDKLKQVLSHWQKIERQVKQEGLSFGEGLRLLAGISKQSSETASLEQVSAWSTVVEGSWLSEILTRLRHPEASRGKNERDEKSLPATLKTILKKYLKTELRPYQERGVQWLWWLYHLRLGGCLADDMGLGKTIQVLSLLLLVKHQTMEIERMEPKKSKSHLLILPASLLGNWQSEINRFAPSLVTWIAHSSAEGGEPSSAVDLVITTYGMMHRLTWLSQTTWDMVIVDEAQAIKNPAAKQTHAIKVLNSQVRFILTGTPIENKLFDLWSLFDFIAPGLLGSSKVFAGYSKQKQQMEQKINNDKEHKGYFYAAVRQLISPYILRRLKSDKQIIADLPDKTEMPTYCTLTKQQVGLYQQTVNELQRKLEQSMDGIQRRGLVLSYLLRFKQICNHPSQWLGHGQYDPANSGKLLRLQELCQVIAEKQEKVLVFTQFREIIPALCEFLTQLFGCEGLLLHGQTPIKERAKRVEAFQQEQGPPFFVLSLKAGGTGINLTAASHVIHFDRWWNPAVENQATDRAYRIGQKKNVLVHKFICRGTIEEKIDTLINSKKSLSEEMIGQGGEVILTELSDAELLNMVSLDIHRAFMEK